MDLTTAANKSTFGKVALFWIYTKEDGNAIDFSELHEIYSFLRPCFFIKMNFEQWFQTNFNAAQGKRGFWCDTRTLQFVFNHRKSKGKISANTTFYQWFLKLKTSNFLISKEKLMSASGTITKQVEGINRFEGDKE